MMNVFIISLLESGGAATSIVRKNGGLKASLHF